MPSSSVGNALKLNRSIFPVNYFILPFRLHYSYSRCTAAPLNMSACHNWGYQYIKDISSDQKMQLLPNFSTQAEDGYALMNMLMEEVFSWGFTSPLFFHHSSKVSSVLKSSTCILQLGYQYIHDIRDMSSDQKCNFYLIFLPKLKTDMP